MPIAINFTGDFPAVVSLSQADRRDAAADRALRSLTIKSRDAAAGTVRCPDPFDAAFYFADE